jgi:cytoskeletal protein RodZ
MQKKQLFNVLAVLLIIAGVVLTVIGIMRYRDETRVQQSVLEEYRWDDNGKKQSKTVDVSGDTTETTEDTSKSENTKESESKSDAKADTKADTMESAETTENAETPSAEQPAENAEAAQ